MINLIRHGSYQLLETKKQTKILILDQQDAYAWPYATDIGELLVTTHNQHQTDQILSLGKYKMYQVVDEPNLADITHLELEVGDQQWQGYILLTGLPDQTKKRTRIIPTKELITKP